MFLSNAAKSLLAGLLLMLSTTGCGIFGTRGDIATRISDDTKSNIPFMTTEPENFQCEIVETAGKIVRRKRIAKKGTWRRVDLDYGEPAQRALLQTDKNYILDIGRGLYAEGQTGTGGQFSELTHELLNTGQRSEFEETSRDGNLAVYTVRPADGGSSEIVVHYDEAIGMPVKQEFFSLAGGTRTLAFTVEIVNFKREPDADAFSIPSGFKKVPIGQLLL